MNGSGRDAPSVVDPGIRKRTKNTKKKKGKSPWDVEHSGV